MADLHDPRGRVALGEWAFEPTFAAALAIERELGQSITRVALRVTEVDYTATAAVLYACRVDQSLKREAIGEAMLTDFRSALRAAEALMRRFLGADEEDAEAGTPAEGKGASLM